MKRIKYLIPVLVAALVIPSCNKDSMPISDRPLDISITKLEANRAVMKVIPENNDIYYMFGVAPAEAVESVGQEEFVNMVDMTTKQLYNILFDTTSLDNFLEWMYRGEYDEVMHGLETNTKYYAYAYPYDGINPMADKFVKMEFSTLDIRKSENKFDVSVEGSVISVNPSNGDSYFFDYCTLEELDDYYMSIDYFFRKSIDIYWEYGFLDTFITKGASSEDMKKYYKDIADGDVFYMALSGYDKGITTDVTYYKITVHFGTAKSTIEQIPDFTISSYGTDDIPSKATWPVFPSTCKNKIP